MRKKQNFAMLDDLEDATKQVLDEIERVSKSIHSAASPQMLLYAENQTTDLCLVLKTVRESFLMQSSTDQMLHKEITKEMQNWNNLRELRSNFNKTTASQRPIYEKYMRSKAALEANPNDNQKKLEFENDKREVEKKCPKFEEEFGKYQNALIGLLLKSFEIIVTKANEKSRINSETIVEITPKADAIVIDASDPVLPQLEESLQRFSAELIKVEDSLSKLPPAPEKTIEESEEEDSGVFKID